MNIEAGYKSIGQEPSCDLVLDLPGISQRHASLELAVDGLVSVIDTESDNGTYLNRGDRWVKIKRVILCIGDRVRFAEHEVQLDQLTAVFGEHSNARLEARHFAIAGDKASTRFASDIAASSPTLNKPVRNPLTGKIEEQSN